MKKVFRIRTQAHMNAAPHQDMEIHQWLVNVLTNIARDTVKKGDINEQGIEVDVIVEVLV